MPHREIIEAKARIEWSFIVRIPHIVQKPKLKCWPIDTNLINNYYKEWKTIKWKLSLTFRFFSAAITIVLLFWCLAPYAPDSQVNLPFDDDFWQLWGRCFNPSITPWWKLCQRQIVLMCAKPFQLFVVCTKNWIELQMLLGIGLQCSPIRGSRVTFSTESPSNLLCGRLSSILAHTHTLTCGNKSSIASHIRAHINTSRVVRTSKCKR